MPCGRVRTVAQALDEEVAIESGLVKATVSSDLPMVGNPIRIDGTRGSPRMSPPALGEHTDEILGELGFDRSQIAALRADGVV